MELTFNCFVTSFFTIIISNHFESVGVLLCFHVISFNYGTKGLTGVHSDYRCHQSKNIPDSVFSFTMAKCISFG